MSRTIISVENLGKEYVIGGRESSSDTFREMIVSAAAAPFRRLKRLGGKITDEESIWALKDVSFEVRQGEVVGIIGRNGAGKSTLLKILSRITEPTTGRVEIRGRVSSLLEVGTGFHTELTGRENIYLNGAILGMTRAEIGRKFDEIVDFSGVEKFLDTPVKRYSSGMSVRLAFAVAAHLEPEILIIDEVLAVGDAEFQRKCLGKMKDVAGAGRTVLFVSHNMGAVRQLCERGIVVKAGQIVHDGDVDGALSAHLGDTNGESRAETERSWSGEDAPGGPELRLRAVAITGEKSPGPTFRPDEAITVALQYEQRFAIPGLRFNLRLLTMNGETAFTTTDQVARKRTYGPGVYETRCIIPGGLLNRIPYVVSVTSRVPRQAVFLAYTEVGQIFIEGIGNESSSEVRGSWPGVVCPSIDWEITPVSLETEKAAARLESVENA